MPTKITLKSKNTLKRLYFKSSNIKKLLSWSKNRGKSFMKYSPKTKVCTLKLWVSSLRWLLKTKVMMPLKTIISSFMKSYSNLLSTYNGLPKKETNLRV